MNDSYWHGDAFEDFQAECVADQQLFDLADMAASSRTTGDEEWLLREWDVLDRYAASQDISLWRPTCEHGYELFNAGQEPSQPGICTRCFITRAVNQ